MSLWLIHQPIKLIAYSNIQQGFAGWKHGWEREREEQNGEWALEDSLGQSGVSWGHWCEEEHHPVSYGLGHSTCLRIWLCLAEKLAAPLMGSPVSSPTTFLSQIYLPYRGPWSILNANWVITHLPYQWFSASTTGYNSNSSAWFGRSSFMILLFNLFLATAPHSLTFQLCLTTCLPLHLFHSPCLRAFVHAFLPSGMPFPCISLASHYSHYKHRHHH